MIQRDSYVVGGMYETGKKKLKSTEKLFTLTSIICIISPSQISFLR